jgi:hypothetical protein
MKLGMNIYRKLFFVLIFIQFGWAKFCSAQIVPIPSDSGSVWNYVSSDASNPPPIYFYPSYTITGDTIVGSHSYLVVNYYLSYLLREDSIGRIYIRYLDPTLFFCTDTNEILACDFSLGLNDQIYIHSCYGDSILCQVVLVDSVLTNHGYRKQINLSEFTGTLSCATNNGPIKWVDGIGDLNDLFYNLNFFQQGTVCLQYYDFLSLDSAGQNIHFLAAGVGNNSGSNEIYIDNSNTLHSKSLLKVIRIYDIVGRVIWSYFPDQSELEVKLPDGVFDGQQLKIVSSESMNGIKNALILR